MKQLTIGVPVTPMVALTRALSYLLVLTSSSFLTGQAFDEMNLENDTLRLIPTIAFALAYFFIFLTGHTSKADEKFYAWSRPVVSIAAGAGQLYLLNLFVSFNGVSLVNQILLSIVLTLPLIVIFGLTIGKRSTNQPA